MLSAHFERSVYVIVARQRFSHRAQHGEKLDEHMAALRVLTADCNFGSFNDEMLRDQLVSKTTNNNLRDLLLCEGSSLTLSQSITLAN